MTRPLTVPGWEIDQSTDWAGVTVITTAGSDERLAIGMELGADFGVNYNKEDLTRAYLARILSQANQLPLLGTAPTRRYGSHPSTLPC